MKNSCWWISPYFIYRKSCRWLETLFIHKISISRRQFNSNFLFVSFIHSWNLTPPKQISVDRREEMENNTSPRPFQSVPLSPYPSRQRVALIRHNTVSLIQSRHDEMVVRWTPLRQRAREKRKSFTFLRGFMNLKDTRTEPANRGEASTFSAASWFIVQISESRAI